MITTPAQVLGLAILFLLNPGCGTDSPTGATDAADVTVDAAQADAREHKTDAGKLDASPLSCDSLSVAEKGLFNVTFVAGASNSPGCNASPCTLADITAQDVYWARVVKRGYARVESCVAYLPQANITNYESTNSAPSDTSLSISLDAFFHFSSQSLPNFRLSVANYMAQLNAAAPDAPFFVANIPEAMMLDQSDPPAYNAAIADAVSYYPKYHLLDVDARFKDLTAGLVSYDGVTLTPIDILVDPVHINDLGHQLVADLFILLLNEHYPELHLETYGDLAIGSP